MKKTLALALILALCLSLLAGCGSMTIGPKSADGKAEATVITLGGDHADISGKGAKAEGSTVTISAPGSYAMSGELTEGQVIIDLGEVDGDVDLTLEGAALHNGSDAALYVRSAKNVHLLLAEGSENRITSGDENSVVDETSSGAAIFSEDDLSIDGKGSLHVEGHINNAITCKDDFKLKGGSVSIYAVKNGIKGSESVSVSGGEGTITAGNDGIKATTLKKADKGFVTVSGGSLSIQAGGDGIQAETYVAVSGGILNITTSGEREQLSSKGIKAKTELSISGGELTLDTTDHALHCDGALNISGGSLVLSSSQAKALAAKGDVSISGGDLEMRAADDGIASDTAVTVSGGSIEIAAGADGIQAGTKGAMPGMEVGNFSMSGGEVLINAHSDIIDAKAAATVTGGSLCGAGSPKGSRAVRAEGQGLVSFAFSGSPENEVVISSAGGELNRFVARYAFTQVIFTSEDILSGESYSIAAGTVTGSAIA